jgi:hypothetical protein
MPAKLPPVDELLRRLRSGERRSDIVREYGVSQAALHFKLKRAGYGPEDWERKEVVVKNVSKMTDEALNQAIEDLTAERAARFSRRMDESNFIIGKFLWQRLAPSFAQALENNGYGDLAASVRQTLESEVKP